MNDRFVTPDKQLDETAWAMVCAGAARDAADECDGSDASFRSLYSMNVGRLLAQLPAELLARAVQLASVRGVFPACDAPDLRLPERSDAAEHQGLADIAAQEAERLRMLEGMSFELQDAVEDATRGGYLARVTAIGLVTMWRKSGLNAFMCRAPQTLRNNRILIRVVIRSPKRSFFTDYQLELSVSPGGVAYAANVPLQTAEGAVVQPGTLSRDYGLWLISVLQGFKNAAQRMEALRQEPPLAQSLDWILIHAAAQASPGSMR